MNKAYPIIFTFFYLLLLVSSCESRPDIPSVITAAPEEPINTTQSMSSITNDKLLELAVNNLRDAASFEIVTTDIRAYEATQPNQTSQLIYGEDHRKYEVIKKPEIKVKCSQSFRYLPDDSFMTATIFYWQEGQTYFIQEIAQDTLTEKNVITAEQVEPFTNDIYQTLLNYYKEALFVKQEGHTAIYELVHPAWYKLDSAVGFANLGLLLGMDNSEQLIQQYLKDHFQNVIPPIFTIYVDVENRLINKVTVDDRDFMTSIWSNIDMELLKENGDDQTLTKYMVSDLNTSEYTFSNYNQVQDFSLPPDL